MSAPIAPLALDVGPLLEVLFVVFLFILPVVRRILGEGRPTVPPKPPVPERKKPQRRWEELLRDELGVDLGVEPETVAQVEPEPVPVPATAPATAVEPSPPAPPPIDPSSTLGSLDSGFDDPMTEFASVPSEVGVDLADVPSELGDLAQVPSELGPFASGDLDAAGSTLPPGATRARAAALPRPGSWARAIVLSEALGAPVALRDGEATLPGWR